MKARSSILAIAAVVVVLLLALSFYLDSWGGLALLALVTGAAVWYRVQVARGEAAEEFFGGAGEDTRLTSFQGGAPSEMPLEQPLPPREPPA